MATPSSRPSRPPAAKPASTRRRLAAVLSHRSPLTAGRAAFPRHRPAAAAPAARSSPGWRPRAIAPAAARAAARARRSRRPGAPRAAPAPRARRRKRTGRPCASPISARRPGARPRRLAGGVVAGPVVFQALRPERLFQVAVVEPAVHRYFAADQLELERVGHHRLVAGDDEVVDQRRVARGQVLLVELGGPGRVGHAALFPELEQRVAIGLVRGPARGAHEDIDHLLHLRRVVALELLAHQQRGLTRIRGVLALGAVDDLGQALVAHLEPFIAAKGRVHAVGHQRGLALPASRLTPLMSRSVRPWAASTLMATRWPLVPRKMDTLWSRMS